MDLTAAYITFCSYEKCTFYGFVSCFWAGFVMKKQHAIQKYQ